MLRAAVDSLFPRRCAGCGQGGWPFCARCADALIALTPPWCDRCGRPTDRRQAACPDCPPGVIAGSRAAFLYAGPAKAAILKLKFSGWRSVADALAAAIVALEPQARADVITWVPLARARSAERGYDQARALARGCAHRLRVPARPLLRRTAATPPQARRSAAERRLAMAGAFQARGRIPARVILVDDVLTTGATAAACASALRDAGALEVSLLTAARALPGTLPRRYTRVTGSRSGLWLPEEVPR